MQNTSTEARYKKSTPFLHISKSPRRVGFIQKIKWRIFHKSMKMPFWGFEELTKKMEGFI
jgi:hypothetical protein